MISRWIQKSPTEAALGKWTKLLGETCLDVLLGLSLAYFFVYLCEFFGMMPPTSVSCYVGCAVIAVVLPASLYSNWRTHSRSKNIFVCDRCNIVKVADGQMACKCGGCFHTLDEMKWIESAPAGNIRQSA
jgi:hypothetical protein